MSYCGYPVRGSQETKFQVGDEVKILFGRYTGQIGKITGYPYCVQIHTHPKSQVESGEYSPDELKLYIRDNSLMESFRYPNLPSVVS